MIMKHCQCLQTAVNGHSCNLLDFAVTSPPPPRKNGKLSQCQIYCIHQIALFLCNYRLKTHVARLAVETYALYVACCKPYISIFSSQAPVSPHVPTTSESDDRGPWFGRMHIRGWDTMEVASVVTSKILVGA